jgi:hypothetical protein
MEIRQAGSGGCRKGWMTDGRLDGRRRQCHSQRQHEVRESAAKWALAQKGIHQTYRMP